MFFSSTELDFIITQKYPTPTQTINTFPVLGNYVESLIGLNIAYNEMILKEHPGLMRYMQILEHKLEWPGLCKYIKDPTIIAENADLQMILALVLHYYIV